MQGVCDCFGHWTVFMCSEQKVDFVQEMDDKELITHKGVSSTQQISSLVLLCATKTRSHKKKGKGYAGSVLIVLAKGLS